MQSFAKKAVFSRPQTAIGKQKSFSRRLQQKKSVWHGLEKDFPGSKKKKRSVSVLVSDAQRSSGKNRGHNKTVYDFPLSGRVVPAPHTQHLLGPFAALAQNSLLRSFSIVDSLANRQHSCRGSEELAIRKSARFQATPSSYQHSELLRVGSARELRATQSYSEPLRAATRAFRALRTATQSY